MVITIALINLHCNIKYYFECILSAGVLDSDFCYSAGYRICQIFLKNPVRQSSQILDILYTTQTLNIKVHISKIKLATLSTITFQMKS